MCSARISAGFAWVSRGRLRMWRLALSANVPETLTTPRITEQGERATDHEQHFFFFPFLSLV